MMYVFNNAKFRMIVWIRIAQMITDVCSFVKLDNELSTHVLLLYEGLKMILLLIIIYVCHLLMLSEKIKSKKMVE